MKHLKNNLLLVLLFGTSISAQSFIDSTKQWSVLYIDSFGGKWMRTYCYSFKEVHIKNDTIYAKLYYTIDETGEQLILRSFWWETSDNKVYQSKTDFKNGRLTYDFNLQEKDTFIVNENIFMIVDSVKVNKWGGKERKHWSFHSPGYEQWWGPTIWVEGIGQLGDFTSSTETYIIGSWRKLLCFEEDGLQVYQNPEYNGCYITIVNEIKNIKPFLEIQSLNDCSVRINNLIETTSGNLSFFNLSGQRILSKEIQGMSNLGMDINLPGQGIYFYCFIHTNGKTQKGKIFVK